MTITEIKNTFTKELDPLYPKPEIESFFYLLTEALIHLKRIDIALEPSYTIKPLMQQKFISALAKLKKEIPIQYILGKTEFYDMPFIVDKNVLIPRPETEELVDWVIKSEELEVGSEKLEWNILDIGTGSGCIAISLAKNLLNTNVWALDVSEKALKVAKSNAKINRVHIQFINKDILTLEKLPIKFDCIVSNPPYVRELEKKKINKNVLENEPHLALFVKDRNPLLFYDKIADFALNNLNQNGKLYLEINQYLGKETLDLLEKKGFKNLDLKKDVFGNDRMIKGIFIL